MIRDFSPKLSEQNAVSELLWCNFHFKSHNESDITPLSTVRASLFKF